MRSLCSRAFEVVSDPELYFPSGVIGDPTLASYKKGTKNKQVLDRTNSETGQRIEESVGVMYG
jgi:hypothetical protein